MHLEAETLSSFVPTFLVRRAQANPNALQRPVADNLPAAILYADISGFTAWGERLAERGPAGAEELTHILNDYFGRLIDLATDYGGDIVSFAGDALHVLWPAEGSGGDLRRSVQAAAQCAVTVQEVLHGCGVETGTPLAARISIGAGRARILRLGGIENRWLQVLTGSALLQTVRADQQARPGEVVLSPQAARLIQGTCRGEQLPGGFLRVQHAGAGASVQAPARLEIGDQAVEVLRHYIPLPVLTRLTAGQAEWLSELRRLTVLFVSLAELDHQTPLKAAQTAVEGLQTQLTRYGAAINKLSTDDKGTTLVAALGLPSLAHEDDPERGVLAALAVHHGLEKLGWKSAIGVTTGRVFCGIIGNDRRREYTTIGDVINLAARLMQTARAEGGEGKIPILCDEATVQASRERASFAFLPAIEVRGRKELVAIARPLGERRVTARAEPAAIVGRIEERQILSEALLRLQQGQGGVVIIDGEAGIGKSRLLTEIKRMARAMDLPVLMGTGDRVEQRAAYHGWQDVLRQLLRLDPAATSETRSRRVEELLGPDQRDRAPLLNAVLPLDIPETDLTRHLAGPQRAEQIRGLLVTLLQAAARYSPLLIILEDAHWLDSASWAVALEVHRRVGRVTLLLATRPLPEPPPPEYDLLRDAAQGFHLRLHPLSAEDALALACQRLGVARLPETVASFIRERAAGHPFFTEELAYALRDGGVIEVVDGECRLPAGVSLKDVILPETVGGVITSRIDRLPPQHQLTLKVSSVIGTVFQMLVLQDIHPVDSDRSALPIYLQDLERLDLIMTDRPDPDPAYAFKHVITRDVAYNLMLFAQRRELHRTLGEWHERTYGTGDLSPYYPILAYHWSRAGDTDKAVHYLERAAGRATFLGANREAVQLGLEAAGFLGAALPSDPHEIAALMGPEMAEIQGLLAGRRPAQLIDLPDLTDTKIARVIGLLAQLQPAAFVSRQPELFALLGLRNLKLTLMHGHARVAPLVYSMYSVIYRAMTGDSRAAYEFSTLALDLDQRHGGHLTASVEFMHAWFSNHWIAPLERAILLFEHAAHAGLDTGSDILYGCFSAAAVPVAAAAAGRPLEEVISVSSRMREWVADRVFSASYHCLLELQRAKALAGRTVDRMSFTDEAFDEARDLASVCETDNYNQIGYFLVFKAQMHLYYRSYTTALAYAEQAASILPTFRGQIGELDLALYHPLAALGHYDEVEEEDRRALLETATAYAQDLQGWSELCPANFEHRQRLVQAELARVQGQYEHAMVLYRQAADAARRFGFIHIAALALELGGRCALSNGDEGTGRPLLQAASEEYQRWGALAKVADIQEQLLATPARQSTSRHRRR